MSKDRTSSSKRPKKAKDCTTEVSASRGTETPVSLKEITEAIKDLGENRGWIIEVLLAVYISTFLEKANPIWLMVVGNPSSNKTTLTDLFKKCSDVYRLDTLTSNPFISGQREKKGEKAFDLLPALDGKCFIIKEYATFFGRSDEMVKQLLSDLTAIYDGEYGKHSPLRGTVTYKSTFSHIGCVTPHALNSRQKYMNSVGARFLFLRIPSLSREEREGGLDTFWATRPKKSKNDITDLITKFCERIQEYMNKSPEILFSSETQKTLNMYATFIARTRGVVISEATNQETSNGGKQTNYEVCDIQIEEPFRALKQLKKLAECLTLIHQKSKVDQRTMGDCSRNCFFFHAYKKIRCTESL